MKFRSNRIDILGTTWTIQKANENNDSNLINNFAYTDNFAKIITYEPLAKRPNNTKKLDECQKEVLRHEIIHAFLFESGLEDYSKDEVLVNYIAIQFYKLDKLFKELGVSEGNK